MREMYDDKFNFQQYKALAVNGIGVITETKAPTNDQTVYVYYRFQKDPIQPIPYFVRGDGVFSNTNGNGSKAAAKYYDNRKYEVGEQLIGSNNTNYNKATIYSINLSDGESHYILFDKKYEGASLTLDTNQINLGFSDLAVNAQIVNLTHNGVTQDAIRLSGGDDYIEYTRTAFDKEIWFDVQSAYYDNGASQSGIPMLVDVPSETIDTITLSMNVQVIDRKGWDNVTQRYTGNSTVYFMVKPEFIYDVLGDENLRVKAKSVHAEPKLHIYTESYNLYFFDNDFNTADFNEFKNQKCDRKLVYDPYFIYSNIYYTEFKEMWDGYINNNQYNTSVISGERIQSLLPHGYTLKGEILSSDVPVYGYLRNNLMETGWYYNFDHGLLKNQAAYKTNLGTKYNANLLYSTTRLEYMIIIKDPSPGELLTSEFNVMTSSYPANKKFVYVTYENQPSAVYQKSSLSTYHNSKSWHIWEQFVYYGMRNTNAWNEANRDYIPITNYWRNWVEYTGYSTYSTRMLSLTDSWVTIMSNDYKQQLHSVGNTVIKSGYYSQPIITGGETITGYKKHEVFSIDKTFGINKWGTNIFNENDIYNWSPLYYTTTNLIDHLAYAPSSAQHRLRVNNNVGTIITPYYIFNRFPFRYEQQEYNGQNYIVENPDDSQKVQHNRSRNIISLRSMGGKPMPSINKTPVNEESDTININYTVFSVAGDAPTVNNVMINVTYQKRKCHYMYSGSEANDSWVNYVNISGNPEMQGVIKEYYVNGNLHEHFNKSEGSDSYVVDDSDGKTRLRDLIDQP
jgi:hypothetical protein